MKQTDFHQDIERFSLLNAYYAYMDTDAYLADQLFIKHQVRVHFREEYVRDGSPYRVIFCHVRKRDQERFLAALNELPGKMMLLGYTDYLDACRAIWGNRKSHNEKEVTDCDAVRTTEQAWQEGAAGILRPKARLLAWSEPNFPDCTEQEGL